MKCLKQLHEAKKTLWKVTAFEQYIYNYPQHMTAQRVTASCSVIHTSFSLLSSLLSPLLSHTLLSFVLRQKKPKLIQTGKSLWPCSRNSGVFCRILVIFTEIEGRNKKPRSCSHFGTHGISCLATPTEWAAAKAWTIQMRKQQTAASQDNEMQRGRVLVH